MSVALHLPPRTPLRISDKEPLVFLAGPIQGAPDWQYRAYRSLAQNWKGKEDLRVASPRRYEMSADFVYEEQVAWEKQGLKRAAKHGAVVFWFAKQDKSLPYEANRAYAQTSRIEFGRVLGWKDEHPEINMVLGIEQGYKGSEKYYRTCADEIDIPVYDNLEDLCVKAIKLLRKN